MIFRKLLIASTLVIASGILPVAQPVKPLAISLRSSRLEAGGFRTICVLSS